MPRAYSPDEAIAAFWAKVNKDGPIHPVLKTACWEWAAGRTGAGYGSVDPKHVGESTAHRASWRLHNGPVPDGLQVLHRCDNPPCIRPDHLFVGTHDDNMKDATAKGRIASGLQHHSSLRPEGVARGARNGAHTHPERIARGDRSGSRLHPERVPRGESHPHAKLSEADVISIRQRCAAGELHRDVAASFGILRSTISQIVTRKRWKHVP